jgi:hypothetical protein
VDFGAGKFTQKNFSAIPTLLLLDLMFLYLLMDVFGTAVPSVDIYLKRTKSIGLQRLGGIRNETGNILKS